jgi:hypothetical protein
VIPAGVCLHYWPRLARQCDAGLRAPADCHGCPAYCDGTRHLEPGGDDQERAQKWGALRQIHYHGRQRLNRV